MDLANDGPVVVVLDEFQYILGSNEVTSHLVAAWDPAPKNLPKSPSYWPVRRSPP